MGGKGAIFTALCLAQSLARIRHFVGICQMKDDSVGKWSLAQNLLPVSSRVPGTSELGLCGRGAGPQKIWALMLLLEGVGTKAPRADLESVTPAQVIP